VRERSKIQLTDIMEKQNRGIIVNYSKKKFAVLPRWVNIKGKGGKKSVRKKNLRDGPENIWFTEDGEDSGGGGGVYGRGGK